MPFDQILDLEERIGPKRAQAVALKEKLERLQKRVLEKEKERLEDSLIEFHKAAWEHMDPSPYVHGRHLDAISEHLEAVAYGEIRKLLINLAPRHSKSLLVSVSFPAWLWAKKPDPEYPMLGAQLRLLCLSYGDTLSLDLALTHRRLIQSDWYQERWGDRVRLCADQEAKSKFDTTAGGSRISASFQGGITGRGGLLRIIDDPIKAGDEVSEPIRQKVLDIYEGTLKSRITDPKKTAEIVVMQRLHPQDLSGHILEQDEKVDADDPLSVVHLCLPEVFEECRRCSTTILNYGSGKEGHKFWTDWREEGELLWPERFGHRELAPFKSDEYQWKAQWLQRPEIKGSGILKRDYWRIWDKPKFPECDFVLACLDSAFTEKESNDPCGFTIWGTFLTDEGERGAILLYAFRKWLEISGPYQSREPDESDRDYRDRCKPQWGITETVHDLCKNFTVDHLIVENKASGLSIVQVMSKLMTRARYTISTVDPKKLDKTARMNRVQPEFANGQIWAPKKSWADMVISECAGDTKYDDLIDSVTHAVYYLRSAGFLERREEQFLRLEEAAKDYKKKPPLYRI